MATEGEEHHHNEGAQGENDDDDDDDDEEDAYVDALQNPVEEDMVGSELNSHKRRRGVNVAEAAPLRKNPKAPKRFKSSYILFFVANQAKIKAELGETASVADISKRSAEIWRGMSSEERQEWVEAAAKDKQRYIREKAVYTGPWQVPLKRQKKDPSAPRRSMSAFLYFSQGRRTQLKDENPHVKNTEISRMLGEIWRNAPEEVRQPFIEREKREREKYKADIAHWRKEHVVKVEQERKLQFEAASIVDPYAHMVYNMGGGGADQDGGVPPINGFSGMQPAQGMFGQPMAPPYGYPYAATNNVPRTGPHQFPSSNNSKPIILGPNGMPLQSNYTLAGDVAQPLPMGRDYHAHGPEGEAYAYEDEDVPEPAE